MNYSASRQPCSSLRDARLRDEGVRDSLRFSCVGVGIAIRCDDPALRSLLAMNFEAMDAASAKIDVEYDISANGAGALQVVRDERRFEVADTGQLVLALESDLVVEVQKRRPQHLFLHSAALVLDGVCHLLVGRSGAGKSTTCWGMVSNGFGYLSDEMAPIDLTSMTVARYPHALCLKSPPPPEYPLPRAARRTSRGYHVPSSAMPVVVRDGAVPLGVILFVEYDAELDRTRCRRLNRAEVATRLYPNVLNALAHGNAGLEAAANVAAACPGWRLRFSSLPNALHCLRKLIASGVCEGA